MSEWQKVGFVAGKGTVTTPIRYEFYHRDLAPGVYEYRLRQVDTDGSFEYSEIVTAVVGVPETFVLHQNFPNPFNPSTRIKYEIPKSRQVTLIIYNILGAAVRTLVDDQQNPGAYEVEWDGRNDAGISATSGVFFYKLTAGQTSFIRKMILLQ